MIRVFLFTLGDPGGIGPEVVIKSLLKLNSSCPFIPIIVGSKAVFEHPLIAELIESVDTTYLEDLSRIDTDSLSSSHLYLYHAYDLEPSFTYGKPDTTSGNASFQYLEAATQLLHEGVGDALITGPISKTSFKMAGISYTGHTTYLQDKTGADDVSMAFYTPTLSTVLATIHIPLMSVSQALTQKRLQTTLDHAMAFATLNGVQHPKIALAGLNPHAGEDGLFGDEEGVLLQPFVETAQAAGSPLSGPYPPDTLYHRAHTGEFDVVISLYHDQGLIPVKLLAFESAVNVTLGLPFLRTSPDHGTAFDIAYTGQASSSSCEAAISYCMNALGSHD